jgi:uncharacterized protein (DUF4415 family)
MRFEWAETKHAANLAKRGIDKTDWQRLDAMPDDAIDCSQGRGYQTRMNALLRAYVEAQKNA